MQELLILQYLHSAGILEVLSLIANVNVIPYPLVSVVV